MLLGCNLSTLRVGGFLERTGLQQGSLRPETIGAPKMRRRTAEHRKWSGEENGGTKLQRVEMVSSIKRLKSISKTSKQWLDWPNCLERKWLFSNNHLTQVFNPGASNDSMQAGHPRGCGGSKLSSEGAPSMTSSTSSIVSMVSLLQISR